MAVLFWIFLDQICPKWIKHDQTWSNLIKLDFSLIKKCYYKKLPHLQKGWQWLFYFGFFWSDLSKLDQTWSNLIKPDQNGFSPIKKCYYKKLSHLQYRNDRLIFDFFWIRSVKNGSNLIKLFGQKRLFGSNGFSAETAFCPKTLVSNLKWLSGSKNVFFKWICLTSQSIERFGSPLMAESFQACLPHFSLRFIL